MLVSYEEDGVVYVSSEPCHYGMFGIPIDVQRDDFIPHLRRIEFQPYPWQEAKVREEA